MEGKTGEWNQRTDYALGMYKHVTRALGTWPFDNQRSSALKILIIITMQVTSVIIFIRDWMIKGNCGTISEILDAITILVGFVMTIPRILLPRMQQTNMSQIMSSAIEDWRNADDEADYEIMFQYARRGRVLCIVQIWAGYVATILLVLLKYPSLATVDELHDGNITLRNVPIGPSCWMSSETSRFTYLFYYFYICLNLFILVGAYLGVNVVSFGIAMHLCGQFEVLHKNLECINDNEGSIPQREKLLEFSRRHSKILMLAANFEAAFSGVIILELGMDTVLLGASEIILIWACKHRHNVLIIVLILRMYLLYIEIFMFSFIGEQLSSHAEKLQVAIYNSPWYNMSLNIMREMIFIMMRNNYPLSLTAGKIYKMNFESFKNIIKSMFSYFSIMRLMFDE